MLARYCLHELTWPSASLSFSLLS